MPDAPWESEHNWTNEEGKLRMDASFLKEPERASLREAVTSETLHKRTLIEPVRFGDERDIS